MTETVQYGGWHFPKGEQHLPQWMKKVQDWRPDPAAPGTRGRLLYQGRKYREALRFVRGRRNAIDVGGHIGLWSWQMSLDFRHAWAFEPMPDHRACYNLNMASRSNWTLYENALGEEEQWIHVRTRTVGSSGDTGVDLNGKGERVFMVTLDEFEFNEVDFLKVDCEGFEVFVLKGAIETLKRNRPCIIVEQKPETGMVKNYGIGVKDAVKFLKSLGAVERLEMAGDHIMSWNP